MRTDYCGLLNINYLDKKVKLCGWVNSLRILKNIIFIDLRDCTGIIQIFVYNNKKKLWNLASSLTEESCIQVYGKIKKRILNNIKDNINNGNIEVLVNKLNIFNYSNKLPLDIKLNNNSEEIRLQYRYLDLRRFNMFNTLKIRSIIVLFLHKFFQKNSFLEIETPFLTKSFPEGAKNYFVFSKSKKDIFYALPQSPQIFKQLLMISGIDRYYQIVKCFRDEDLRSDRQPEFTQIDMELSFSNFNTVRFLIEKLISSLWLNFKNVNFNVPFKIIKYCDSILYYGTDKPDLRNPLKFIDISMFKKNILLKLNSYINFKIKALIVDKNVMYFDFKFILNLINKYGLFDCICIKIINLIKNKFIYELFSFLNFKDDLLIQNICVEFKLKIGDLFFIFIGKKIALNDNLNLIRQTLCKKFKLLKNNKFCPVWITDFPLFYYDNNNNLKSHHHPFTMPLVSSLSYLKSDYYSKLLSSSYDLVINGYELGSGSTRIHDFKIQKKIFDLLGISKLVQKKKYGFFLNSLKFGTPPHIGLALGLDRIIMLLMDIKNIRDVIAFPKTTSGICLLTGAPDDKSSI